MSIQRFTNMLSTKTQKRDIHRVAYLYQLVESGRVVASIALHDNNNLGDVTKASLYYFMIGKHAVDVANKVYHDSEMSSRCQNSVLRNNKRLADVTGTSLSDTKQLNVVVRYVGTLRCMIKT